MTTQTLPPISASLQTAIRAYGLANGWKNCARELAYGPVTEATPGPTYSAPPKARRNGHKDNGAFPHIPGIGRNAAGGFKCSKPGGYEREWGHLMGIGIYKKQTGMSTEAMLAREASLPRHPAES